MTFELLKKQNNWRVGKLHTKSGEINTPFFMPIATKGAVKNISPEDLEKMGAEIILGNTYHLWLRPGDELIARAGGLHEFMQWPKAILTDSGGYQVFSLGARAKEKFGTSGVKISEEGVKFTDPVDGSNYFMSPEKSIEIQLNLGSDIIMVFDECPPFPCSHVQAQKSMELTLRWAKRCFEYFHARVEQDLQKYKNGRPLLFCIVQGSVYEDLRKECTEKLIEIGLTAKGGENCGWDGYAIGGVAVGEPRKHLYEILEWVVPLLPAEKPRYLMGLGKPEELVRAVSGGMDMFDCVIPTREGRHGRLFVMKKNESLEKYLENFDNLFYETINIGNEKFKEDFTPIDADCRCETCQNFTRAYLNHLLRTNEPLYLKLASVHNLHFYLSLMKKMRESF